MRAFIQMCIPVCLPKASETEKQRPCHKTHRVRLLKEEIKEVLIVRGGSVCLPPLVPTLNCPETKVKSNILLQLVIFTYIPTESEVLQHWPLANSLLQESCQERSRMLLLLETFRDLS